MAFSSRLPDFLAFTGFSDERKLHADFPTSYRPRPNLLSIVLEFLFFGHVRKSKDQKWQSKHYQDSLAPVTDMALPIRRYWHFKFPLTSSPLFNNPPWVRHAQRRSGRGKARIFVVVKKASFVKRLNGWSRSLMRVIWGFVRKDPPGLMWWFFFVFGQFFFFF